MNQAQHHRGPDDDGIEVVAIPNGRLILGHRRLSIIDLSPTGHQPMSSRETGDWIVYNGELYNYRELRASLTAEGCRFIGSSDTEVVLNACSAWGEQALNRFHGMYAFCFYSASRAKLLLATDPFGIKPLYYGWGKFGFVFASERRAIDASGLIERELDRRALAGVLAFGAVQGPLTISKGIHQLEPGALVEVDLSQDPLAKQSLPQRKYWKPPIPRDCLDPKENVEEVILSKLKDSIKDHLISDVPVGIFLSSGLDSSAVAAICGEIGADLRTFTVSVADDKQFDESPIAEHTAASIGFSHHKIAIPEMRARDFVGAWIAALDQPSLDGLNTFIISQAVRQQGILVALSGLGGDEIFGGYPSFEQVPKALRWLKSLEWLPLGVRRQILMAALGRGSDARRQKASELANTSLDVASIYFRRRRLLSDKEIANAGLTFNSLELNSNYQVNVEESDRNDLLDANAQISRLESRYYMANMLLRDTDVCSMAHGLEVRVPFLDRRISEYMFALPHSVRHGAKSKELLRRAIRGLLPEKVLRLPKQGFSLPQAKWMIGPLRSYFEDGLACLRNSGLLDPSCINEVWSAFIRNPDGPDWSRAWILGVVGHWYGGWSRIAPARMAVRTPPSP